MSYISKWRLQNNSVVPVGSNLFGTCNSGSSDTTKVVSLSAFNVLVEGVTIHVYFANANSGSNTLLQVGSTSAQPIKRNGVAEGKWESGSVISFTYSQGYWVQNDADVGGGGGGETYTLSKSGDTITLTGSGGDTSSVTDDNTTYTFALYGGNLVISGSDGSQQVVPIPDNDTTYTISISGNDITLTPSSGTAQTITLPIPTKTSDLTNDSGFITGMEILSYGNSTWQNFIDAYNAKKVVYCRASSNSNPASGSQTRLAFMAYVNNASTPTEVEFQYYRSIATHSASQQGDQVFVYKLNKTNGWTVTTREATTKILPSTGLQSSYSNGTLTITAPHDTTKQDTLVSGTNIKTINNTSLLGSGNITVSAEDEIFVCEYGVTSFADALVAYNAGKRLVCHYNDGANDFFVWLVICDSESTYFWFEVTSGDKRMEFCLDSNGWTRSEYPASAIPIARRISKFNSDARMNSMDMTSSEVEDFVDELNVGASGLLDMFYPVGSIYQTVDDGFNPNTRWGGTWELIEEGRFLQATETSQTGGDDVEAGLPNITGNWWGGYGEKSPAGGSGALFVYSNGSYKDGFGTGWKTGLGISLDASRSSSIYGKSNTVQPSAIKVYMWHRTA